MTKDGIEGSENFKAAKEELDRLFDTFAAEAGSLKEITGNEELKDLEDSIESMTLSCQTLVQDFEARSTNKNSLDVRSLIKRQNSLMTEKLDGMFTRLSEMEKQVEQMNLGSTPSSTPNATSLKKVVPGSSISGQQRDSVPSKSAYCTLNPNSQEFFISAGALPPYSSICSAGNKTQLDVAGFILSYELMGDHKFTFKGDPIEYVEYIRHFNSCYASKISDPDILITCLFDMLDCKALHAMQGYRQLPGQDALQDASKMLSEIQKEFARL